MKFLHLADLHLGKNVCGFSMLEDQWYILSQILQICDGQKPDAVLLAGDIYDRALPPADAVQLLDWFLTELHRRNLPVFLISGNHDSAERLEFGAALMEQSNIYISHPLADTNRAYTRNDEFGPVHIWLLPFLRPGDVRAAFGEDAADVHSYEEAVQFVLDRFPLNPSERNVLVAHQFVLGSERSDSEDASIGTVDAIPGNLFRDFDYVALGHIHKPQNMGRGIRYPGTPLKYAFSEIHQQKSATLVTLGPKGSLDLNTVPLRPLREMKEVRGTYEEVTDLDGTDEDYVRIVLTEEQDIPNAVNKLRLHYPHLNWTTTIPERGAESRLILRRKSRIGLRRSSLRSSLRRRTAAPCRKNRKICCRMSLKVSGRRVRPNETDQIENERIWALCVPN